MPYIEAEPFLQEVNHATDYVKTALDTDEVVVFTDRIQRSAFILAQNILDGFEKPYKPYVFGYEEHKDEIMKLLDKMTNGAELPHLFYKKAYVAGSRALGMQYESGELEERLEVEPYMELPKMYPDETDYALRKVQLDNQAYRQDVALPEGKYYSELNFVIAQYVLYDQYVQDGSDNLLVSDCDPSIINFIKQEINSRKVVIFSKSYCSFSKKAKHVFHDCDSIYYAIELDLRNDGFEILDALKKMTGNERTPFVFFKGDYLGGGAKDFGEIHEIDKIRIMLDIPPKPVYPLNRVYERTKEHIKKKYLIDDLENPNTDFNNEYKKVCLDPPKRDDMDVFMTPNMPDYASNLIRYFFREKDRYGHQLRRVPE